MAFTDTDDNVLRARRTAAFVRLGFGVAGLTLSLAKPTLAAHPAISAAGFALIVATSLVQIGSPGISWMKAEESLAGIAALLIIGLGDQRVTGLAVLWLAAVTTGVLGRGGRLHWIGRVVVLGALALPVVREGRLAADQGALYIAALGLMLASGRLTGELRHLLSQARHDADHDDLTGLLSRPALRAALEAACAGAGPDAPVSLLLLDLDGFEVVNKTAGHAAGDALLASWGERLRLARGAHDVAGRLGGDELALIVQGADAEPLARRLISGAGLDSGELRGVSASIGIAQAPRDGQGADALLRAADVALRVAKRTAGGGQISVYTGTSLSGAGMQSARQELARIIDGEGLAMAVQPIVDLRTGEVHGYEALARFGPQANGAPLHWFALADELGERDALERACLRAALDLFAKLPRPANLAVNVSAPVLLDRRTLSMLDGMGDLSGLIIEVTEEALVQSDAQLKADVAPLRARGATLAVDDMGSGYSGLRQVTTVHPSYLKLDRSLISGIDGDAERAALVAALVGYAERVGSLIVAEGIETDAELRTLVDLKVPLAQGFFLSRPGAPWPEIGEDALDTLADCASSGSSSLRVA
ncbi:MAG: EAL domain-containing protein [Solirubrobacteraceae bacterium]